MCTNVSVGVLIKESHLQHQYLGNSTYNKNIEANKEQQAYDIGRCGSVFVTLVLIVSRVERLLFENVVVVYCVAM